MKSKAILPPSSASKPNFKILHFIFIPNLWFSGNDGDFIKEQEYPTEDDKINKAVEKFILSDKMNYLIDSILYDYKVLDYYFENNLIHIIVDTGKNISIKDLANKLYDISIEGNAPDLWMEGDISVTDNIEFTPRIYKLFSITGNVQKEINLNNIPKSEGYY